VDDNDHSNDQPPGSATGAPTVKNRRLSPRRRQYRGGQLVFNQMFSAMDCLVRDISEGGARIECENTQVIPQHLILKLGDRESFECEVVWKSRSNLGVRFSENAKLNDFLHQLAMVHRQVRFPVTEMLAQADGFKNGAFGRVNRPGFGDYLARLMAASQAFLTAIDSMEKEFGTGEHGHGRDMGKSETPAAAAPAAQVEPLDAAPAPDNDNNSAA
jgi:hypothetical protein